MQLPPLISTTPLCHDCSACSFPPWPGLADSSPGPQGRLFQEERANASRFPTGSLRRPRVALANPQGKKKRLGLRSPPFLNRLGQWKLAHTDVDPFFPFLLFPSLSFPQSSARGRGPLNAKARRRRGMRNTHAADGSTAAPHHSTPPSKKKSLEIKDRNAQTPLKGKRQ